MSGNSIFSASVVSGGLAGYPTVYYERKAVATLRHNLALYPGLDLRQMPNMSGLAMQLYGYTAFAANTLPATEGAPTTGQVLTQNTNTLNLSNFVDYITYSNVAVDTFIAPVIEQGTEELAYRGALSVDKVISTELDVLANTITAARIEITDGTFMTASVARRAGMSLDAADVKPKDNGKYYGVISSLSAYDLINDNTTAGFNDLGKFGFMGKGEKVWNLGWNANEYIGCVGNIDWFKSNALPTETHWQSSANVAYHAYVIGKDGIIGSSLEKTDLGQDNFSVKVKRYTEPSPVDPGNQISASSAYNFYFGCIGRPDGVAGFRRIRVEASITS